MASLETTNPRKPRASLEVVEKDHLIKLADYSISSSPVFSRGSTCMKFMRQSQLDWCKGKLTVMPYIHLYSMAITMASSEDFSLTNPLSCCGGSTC